MEKKITYEEEAINCIARLADGGMRDAITLLDKVLAYSTELTMDNVLQALNITGYDDYIKLTEALMYRERKNLIILLDEIYASGVDFKLFIKNYLQFILDINKFLIIEAPGEAFKYIKIPHTSQMQKWLESWYDFENYIQYFNDLLALLIKLDSDIKWSQNVKADVEATLLLF
jgi:DNA polymerase-3 subunit gamma/tau